MNSLCSGTAALARLSVLLLLALVFAGCETPGGRNPKPNDQAGSPDLLQIGDAVYISFSGVLDPPPKVEDRIRQDGCITLPFVGDLKAAGLTRERLQKSITEAYVPGYYKRLTVNVNLSDRFIYVHGQVRREGAIDYRREMTVLQAISAAGGFTDFGQKWEITVTRADGQIITVDCDRALKQPDLDVTVFPNDKIFVPRRII